ncbi:uncharacterized protein Z518_08036 [Rhinocladiella mackenziei CBS 650.93]|uniref:Short-chain dehydrogenase/reductase family protein n=1 Tax=Rhinocladiella mackenziei CBS 650.93 TaxID=1442369 RepID=A0A0D2FJI5_9EURO|nr:uncharacterized protein Z518_08036 [Rhinocladiella mackenziei CBS 650.93]KIX02097.1 hypothetical protein Z518_08036 [Rhinocladiella mackenziei CBS 650.93]
MDLHHRTNPSSFGLSARDQACSTSLDTSAPCPLQRDLPPLTSNYWGRFLRSQLFIKPKLLPQNTSLSEKVAIVTGASAGLGLESSRQLLSFKLGHLIIAVRSAEKGEKVASQLRQQYPKTTIEVWPLEMSSYESIQTFVCRVDSQLSRIDIAILNAAVSNFGFTAVPSTGHEESIQVNYLSTMPLATLLLPVLKSKQPFGLPAHLMITTTALAQMPGNNYSLSKLLGMMFIWKLEEYVSADDVIVNLVEPGFIKGTALHRNIPGLVVALLRLLQAATARRVEDGATTYLDATVAKGKESHGCYLADWEIRPYPAFLYTPEGKEAMDKLWKETISEFNFANVQGILDSQWRRIDC